MSLWMRCRGCARHRELRMGRSLWVRVRTTLLERICMNRSDETSGGDQMARRLSLHLVFEITGVIAAVATVIYVVVELV